MNETIFLAGAFVFGGVAVVVVVVVSQIFDFFRSNEADNWIV